MKPRIREFLRATPFQPFIIRMADGREYRIDHPEFVLAASSDVPPITIEEADGTQHYLSAFLVTSIERAGPLASAALIADDALVGQTLPFATCRSGGRSSATP